MSVRGIERIVRAHEERAAPGSDPAARAAEWAAAGFGAGDVKAWFTAGVYLPTTALLLRDVLAATPREAARRLADGDSLGEALERGTIDVTAARAALARVDGA